MSIENVYIGNRIREAREDKGLSQTQLGTIVHISYQQIQKYERGKNRIPATTLFYIAEATDKRIDFFLQDLKRPPR